MIRYIITFSLLICQVAYCSIVSAQEQVIYPIEINGETWQLTNLNLTSFANGDEIPNAQTADEWKLANKEGTPAWCYYENREDYGEKYGVLYNWYAVSDERGLAPEGWWVATLAD